MVCWPVNEKCPAPSNVITPRMLRESVTALLLLVVNWTCLAKYFPLSDVLESTCAHAAEEQAAEQRAIRQQERTNEPIVLLARAAGRSCSVSIFRRDVSGPARSHC